jgi:hypothetical protein
MQIPILIEPVAGNGFRSRGGEHLALSAEGATREEVLAKLREQLQARVMTGAAIVPLEVVAEPHPLSRFAGMYSPDDPLVKKWIEEMAQNRRKAERVKGAS